MDKISTLFDKSWKINLALFLFSFGIYSFYFHPVFFNINALLSSNTLDSLKNYYTFVYHIKNDTDLLHFSGMNYPYGEHIIYTDCQPILTFILRLLPFTHHYLIGILHSLIFLSFIITPLILNKILRLLEIDKFYSFFVSLGIALLSPQFQKINGGHFALAYGCLVPLSLLLIILYLKKTERKYLLILFFFNTLLFLLHPYMGFCLSVFSFLSLLFFELINFKIKKFLTNSLFYAISGLFPPIAFKVFMLLTDHHKDRTVEPYGTEVMVENLDSILSPVFGPFKNLMETFFPDRAFHFEGHTYLGFFVILLLVSVIISLPFTFRKIRFRKEMLVVFLSSFLFLLISFGIHLKVFNFLGIQSASANQFRAVCRFAWIFYFTLPVFLFICVYDLFKVYFKPRAFNSSLISLSLLFFSFNLFEAQYFFTFNNHDVWKFTNFFREDLLNAEEKTNLKSIKKAQIQAILPLPIFHGGSEIYDRLGSNNSMLPAMLYSYHSNKPILSSLLSRTSIPETENVIDLLNSYKKEKKAADLLNAKDFFVLITHDALLPDETRLLKKVELFGGNDTLGFGYISQTDLLHSKKETEKILDYSKSYAPDTNSFVFVPFENRKPFVRANINDFETVFVLDSNKIKSGKYIVSLHYYYNLKTYKSLAISLIVTRANTGNFDWQYNLPLRYLSGFYNGYSVFEYKIDLDQKNKYEFILKGFQDQAYTISDFMIRQEGQDVLMIKGYQDTIVNNFPYY